MDVILVLQPGTTDHDLSHLLDRLEEMGLEVHVSRGEDRTVVGLVGEDAGPDVNILGGLPGVERVVPVSRPYRLASRLQSMALADCLIPLPEGVERLEAGRSVRVQLLDPWGRIRECEFLAPEKSFSGFNTS